MMQILVIGVITTKDGMKEANDSLREILRIVIKDDIKTYFLSDQDDCC